MDPSLSVAEVLVKEEMITRRQLDRVRGEYETDKTSQQIPGYTILRKLGSGAMATVFLARQLSLDRLVAIKVLPKRFSANASFIERFYREGRAAAKLNDANVCRPTTSARRVTITTSSWSTWMARPCSTPSSGTAGFRRTRP